MNPPHRTVIYIGNFHPAHSTENHVAQALEFHGHTVHRLQESDHGPGHSGNQVSLTWQALLDRGQSTKGVDLVLWTRTGGLGPDRDVQHAVLDALRERGVPVVGYHLDRWWGLDRAGQVGEEPFFTVDLLVTADGHPHNPWQQFGVNHHWLPPAVSLPETEPAEPHKLFRGDIAFVGSWQGSYHDEWEHRAEMVGRLRGRWRNQVRFWPKRRQPAVRGRALRQLYASVKVAVGDSCLVPDDEGRPYERYWSDRVPETLGRGCHLVHPHVAGINDHYSGDATALWLYPLGDWDAMHARIEQVLTLSDAARQHLAEETREYVQAHHTYERRMEQLFDLLAAEGVLA